jgi:hypothetical protein
MDSDDDDSNPLEDLEALGQKEEQENRMAEEARSATDQSSPTHMTGPARATHEKQDDVISRTGLPASTTADSSEAQTDGYHNVSDGSAPAANGKVTGIDDRSHDAERAHDRGLTEGTSAAFVSKRQNYDPVHDTPPADANSKPAASRLEEEPENGRSEPKLDYAGFRPYNGRIGLDDQMRIWRAS